MNVKSKAGSYIGFLSVSLLILAACNPTQTQDAETSGEGQESEKGGQATVVVLEIQSDEADTEIIETTSVEPASTEAGADDDNADATAVEPTATEAEVAESTETEAATNTPSAAELASSVVLNVAWSGNVMVSVQGSSIILQADGLPSHGSLELYAGKGREGDILQDGPRAQNLNYTIPLNPVYTGVAKSTGGGAIGIAISGATFFNPFEGFEDSSIYAVEDYFEYQGAPFVDGCSGHPTPEDYLYHYHGPSSCLSSPIDTADTHSRIIGYILDGFPIYGPLGAGGATPTGLDTCNGHSEATLEFPDGIYHYHTTNFQPYITNCYMGEVAANLIGSSSGSGQSEQPEGQPEGQLEGQPAGGQPDMAAAAQQLGVTEETLQAALGPPPPDITAAAAQLGVTEDALRAALGVP